MKLADDFFVKLLNFKTECERIIKEQDENGWYNKISVQKEICKSMFILEEKDFKIAIQLCKEYKRSIQRKAYELKLNQFKENGTYLNASNPADFIGDLSRELRGNRRASSDRRMLVDEDLKKHFPEREEINSAVRLVRILLDTNEVEKRFLREQRVFEKHQAKLKSIHEGIDAGNSVLEIVERLEQEDNLY